METPRSNVIALKTLNSGDPRGNVMLADVARRSRRQRNRHFIRTQGAIEAINGIIQLGKRRTRRYCNFTYLRTIAYWVTGKLNLGLQYT